jgi:hypothetical protein
MKKFILVLCLLWLALGDNFEKRVLRSNWTL